jgi:hypothetical protein
VTRDEAVNQAAQIAVDACARRDAMTPREAAEAAWSPCCGRTVEQLEELIRAGRLGTRTRTA